MPSTRKLSWGWDAAAAARTAAPLTATAASDRRFGTGSRPQEPLPERAPQAAFTPDSFVAGQACQQQVPLDRQLCRTAAAAMAAGSSPWHAAHRGAEEPFACCQRSC